MASERTKSERDHCFYVANSSGFQEEEFLFPCNRSRKDHRVYVFTQPHAFAESPAAVCERGEALDALRMVQSDPAVGHLLDATQNVMAAALAPPPRASAEHVVDLTRPCAFPIGGDLCGGSIYDQAHVTDEKMVAHHHYQYDQGGAG